VLCVVTEDANEVESVRSKSKAADKSARPTQPWLVSFLIS
jgi:hypothetical protein